MSLLEGAVVIGVVALILFFRYGRSRSKTSQQIQAGFEALLELKSALLRSVPGVLLIAVGVYFALSRIRQHDSDWWQGLIFIPIGWIAVPLLARKYWRRYRELKQSAEKNAYQMEIERRR